MKKGRLFAEWERYRTGVIPASAGRVQIEETRRAFYGGAGSIFRLMTREVSDGEEMTPEDVALMEGLAAELTDFIDDLQRRVS